MSLIRFSRLGQINNKMEYTLFRNWVFQNLFNASSSDFKLYSMPLPVTDRQWQWQEPKLSFRDWLASRYFLSILPLLTLLLMVRQAVFPREATPTRCTDIGVPGVWMNLLMTDQGLSSWNHFPTDPALVSSFPWHPPSESNILCTNYLTLYSLTLCTNYSLTGTRSRLVGWTLMKCRCSSWHIGCCSSWHIGCWGDEELRLR